MKSVMHRHLRTHAYTRRMMGKLLTSIRGGGAARQKRSDESSDDNDDDLPLAQFAGTEPLLPERWGFTESKININSPDLDTGLVIRMMKREIKNQISERLRSSRRNERNNDDDALERDREHLALHPKYSTLSMIAVLVCMFYKIDLGANLGQEAQESRNRQKPGSENHDRLGEGQTLIDAYFTAFPIQLLEGNLELSLQEIMASFELQIAEYQNLKSGLRLFQVARLELKFYSYDSLFGGRVEKPLPSKCKMTLNALYERGKILHLSYDGCDKLKEDVYTDNCFKHVLAAYHYMTDCGDGEKVPIEIDANNNGFVVKSYLQLHVRDVMNACQDSVDRYDFSMCEDNGRPMRLKDVAKFYAQNYEKDPKNMPYLNLFVLRYANEIDDVLLPKGVESLGETSFKYTVTKFFVSKDYVDSGKTKSDGSTERGVVNVLYWPETKHFYLICNLKALVVLINYGGRLVKAHHKNDLCCNCMNIIDLSHVPMSEHVARCGSDKQYVKYPEPGKNIDKFANYRLNNKVLIWAAADGECTLLPIFRPDNYGFLRDRYTDDAALDESINQRSYEHAYRSADYPLRGATENVSMKHLHRLNSLAVRIHVSDKIVGFPRKKFEKEVGEFTQIMMAQGDSECDEEELVDKFLTWLNKAVLFIREWLKTNQDKDLQKQVLENLRMLNRKLIKESTTCIYCKGRLPENSAERHLDHCHLTREVRGMACASCNMRARVSSWNRFRLIVYFHNFGGYDSSFITKYMKKSSSENDRVYRVRMNGQKIRQLKTPLLDFRDSLDIIPVSIATLSKNLSSANMKNVNKILWANESTDKNCYPYSWVTSVKRFQEKKFPSIDDFESDLTGKVRQEDYEYSNSLYEANCRTFADWHVHYLEMDVLILLDGLVFWQETIHREFGVDLLQCLSLPSCSKQGMMNVTRVGMEIITDPSMNDLFLDSVRGGLCISSLRSYQIADHTKESLRYFDVKSLYAHIQYDYRHPIGDYRYLDPVPEPKELTRLALEYDEKTAKIGHLCIVDLDIPVELHDFLSDFPVTFSKESYEPKYYPPTSKWHHVPKSNVPKLTPSLFNPRNYGVTMLSLQFLVRLGLVIKKVHRVVSFRQEYFLRDFIELCIKKRKASGLKMDDVCFKLLSNGLFGKFLESMYKYTQTKFVFAKHDYERLLKDAAHMIDLKFEKYGVLMTSKPTQLAMNKCVAVGFSILCKSKAHFQGMYYFDILPAYQKIARPITSKNRLRVMYVDTDGIILKMALDMDQEARFYKLLEHIFDFSMLPENDRLYHNANKLLTGIFKDEMNLGLLIKGVHTNGAKSYVVEVENDTGVKECLMSEEERKVYYHEIKIKSIAKFFQATLVYMLDFKNAFDDPKKTQKIECTTLRLGYGRRMYTMKYSRKILCTHDSKRYVHPCQKDSIALGHHRTFDSAWVDQLMKEKDPYTWPHMA